MISIQVDTKPIQDMLERAGREMPFAIAKGLTKTAQDVQAEVIRTLPDKFTLRTGWYKPNTPFGFKITKATKQNMAATVYSRAPWLQLQETGGTKTANGHRVAVPFVSMSGMKPGVQYGVKRTKRDLIQKSQKPRNLQKAFIIHGKRGDLLAQRTGRGKSSILRIMYALEQQTQIKPRLFFHQTAQQVVNRVWRMNLSDAIDYALKTSRFK